MGVNVNHLKNHLRSNSVGGIGTLNHQQIIEMIKQHCSKNDKSVPGGAQPVPAQNALNDQFVDMLIVQMNDQSREQFIQLLKEVSQNKLQQVQMKKISQQKNNNVANTALMNEKNIQLYDQGN